jgi:hypothetical protein
MQNTSFTQNITAYREEMFCSGVMLKTLPLVVHIDLLQTAEEQLMFNLIELDHYFGILDEASSILN